MNRQQEKNEHLTSFLKHVRKELETMSQLLPLDIVFESRPYVKLKERLEQLVKEIDEELKQLNSRLAK